MTNIRRWWMVRCFAWVGYITIKLKILLPLAVQLLSILLFKGQVCQKTAYKYEKRPFRQLNYIEVNVDSITQNKPAMTSLSWLFALKHSDIGTNVTTRAEVEKHKEFYAKHKMRCFLFTETQGYRNGCDTRS